MHDNAFGRLFGVLVAPVKTFESIAARPTVLAALLVTLVLGVVNTALVLPKMDIRGATQEQIEKAVKRSGQQLSDEQMETQVAMAEKVGTIFAWGIAVVGPFVIYPFIALLFWVGLKVMGGEGSYLASLSSTIYGMAPAWLVSGLLMIPIVLGRAELSTEEVQTGQLLLSNLGFLAGEDTSKVVVALLTSVDVFAIWSVILLSLGLSITQNVSRAKAGIVVVGLWLLVVAGKVGLTAVSQAFGG